MECERKPHRLPPYYDRIYLLESAHHFIAKESEERIGVEIGGVLVGFVDSVLHSIVVVAASGPGPHAEHGANTFNRDRAFCQVFLDQHVAATQGVLDFVGEWHKHPEVNPRPSHVDSKTYRTLASDPSCHLNMPLVLIAGTRRPSHISRTEQFVRVNGFVFRRDGFVQRTVRILPDEAYQDILGAISDSVIRANKQS